MLYPRRDPWDIERRRLWSEDIAERIRLYLDVNFWIILRDRSDEAAEELHDLACSAVKSGRIVFPISHAALLEVLKQSDPRSRFRSFQVIDDLSQGATLADEDDRVFIECARLLAQFSPAAGRVDVEPLLWTKPALLLSGDMLDYPPVELPPDLLRDYREFVWRLPLTQLADHFPRFEEDLDLSEIAAKLNAGKREAEVHLTSFKSLLRDEIQGAVDVFSEPILQAWISCLPPHFSAPCHLPKNTRNMFVNAPTIGAKARRLTPTIYLNAAFHALFR